jgi:outer membrane biosynthesis protein TonB
MPSELNRTAVFAAAASFLVALAVAYALTSTGQASEGSGPPGSPAEPLDVVSGSVGNSTLGDAEALPALVVVTPKPKPKPKAEPAPEPTPVEDTPAPAPPAPTATPPAPVTQAPVTPPPAPDPPVEFEDSG